MAGGDHPVTPPASEGGPAPPSPPITPQQLVASRPDWAITAPCGLNVAATARREEERGIAGAA